jgi:hypothetical protein
MESDIHVLRWSIETRYGDIPVKLIQQDYGVNSPGPLLFSQTLNVRFLSMLLLRTETNVFTINRMIWSVIDSFHSEDPFNFRYR